MGSVGQIALLIAFLVSVASADYYSDGCKDVVCKAVGRGVRYPNPRDECSFCCCSDDDRLNKGGEYRQCTGNRRYDSTLNKCVPSSVCPHPKPPMTCDDIKCLAIGEGERVPHPSDECSFCCCYNGTYAKEKNCPNKHEYDGVSRKCVPSTRCPADITTPKTPHGKDGCHLVQHKCKIPEDMTYTQLFANPWDPHSYCACAWGKVHWMPCSPGSFKFDDDLKICI